MTTTYVCERGCRFESAIDVPFIQVYGPDERAYCAFCEFKRKATASFNKGFEHLPVLTEWCVAVREDIYPTVLKLQKEAAK